MSTDAAGSPGFGSVRAAGAGFAASQRFSRPSQLDPALIDHMSGGLDPQQLSDMSHATAEALLDRVHHSADPDVVRRTLNLVETEGVDLVAELWSRSDADTLPGTLWRLYMLRTWMRRNDSMLSRIWRAGEPVDDVASAVAGIDEAPTADDIARTADSILSGAFTGDFAMALDRASAFCQIIAEALAEQAKGGAATGAASVAGAGAARGETNDVNGANDPRATMKTARALHNTAKDFHTAAHLWRDGALY